MVIEYDEAVAAMGTPSTRPTTGARAFAAAGTTNAGYARTMTESESPKGAAGDERLRHGEADVDLEPMGDDDEFSDPADRLVAPDQGLHEDIDPEAVADEVGIDAGAGDDEVVVYELDD